MRTLRRKTCKVTYPFVARIVIDDVITHRLIETTDSFEAYKQVLASQGKCIGNGGYSLKVCMAMDIQHDPSIQIQPLTRQITFQHPFKLELDTSSKLSKPSKKD